MGCRNNRSTQSKLFAYSPHKIRHLFQLYFFLIFQISLKLYIRCEQNNNSASSSPSANIPLMRIVQSVKHTKKRDGKAVKEGWLVHFTNKDKVVRRHYWRLDSKAITMFVSDQGSKYYREIPLIEILAIDTARTMQAGKISI
jgi:hypothetical protein